MNKQDRHVYTVATAHLDTVWNWDLEGTIEHCILRTLKWNFRLFEKYPEYVFNFEGAYRYELMQEYYPELFAKLREYVRKGRWNPCGSAYENGDVNVPSPEALFRNFLYGNEYFDKTFGVRSKDVFLPDCFGFGYALPCVASHSNLWGFTTQKLSWGSACGMPFDIGKWYGPDGKYIIASLDMHNYFAVLSKPRDSKVIRDKLDNCSRYGLDSTEIFHGVGDRGGSPLPVSVSNVVSAIRGNHSSDIKVHSARSDELFRRIMTQMDESQREALPSHNDELLLTNHGTGGYTSRAISKRWNRRCEELADMTERSAVAATWLGASQYPEKQLEISWKRFIAHQFHDDLPGTSIQRVYLRTWNDYGLSLNQLSHEYEQSVAAVASTLDTSFCKGIALVVHNSLEYRRKSCVSAVIDGEFETISVVNSRGEYVESQVLEISGGKTEIAFCAEVDSLGYAVYDAVCEEKADSIKSSLTVTQNQLENERYTVKLDSNGDIASIFDKLLNRELLKKPVILGMYDYSGSWLYPAWELKYEQSIREPQRKAELVEARIIENGAARVAIKVVQKADKSIFTNIIALSAGSDIVSVHSEIEWNSLRTLLKNQFCFTSSNEYASFDLGLGAIKRENAKPSKYEVPAQKWADITDENGGFGVAVLSDCKYGWDKYNNNTLRLTVLHTPLNNSRTTSMQSLMDLGLNRYGYGICAHEGSELTRVQQAAREFSAPMAVFVTSGHKGKNKNGFSFGSISDSGIIIRAIKKAENSDEIVVRVNEGENRHHEGVRLYLGNGIKSAKEIYASEEYICDACTDGGSLVFDMKPYEVKSFALTLDKCSKKAKAVTQKPLALPYNVKAFSRNGEKNENTVGIKPFSIPCEITPTVITSGGIDFYTGDRWGKGCNAVIARGQTVELDSGSDSVYILCASLNGDKSFSFEAGGKTTELSVSDLEQRPHQWDLYSMKKTARIKTDTLGWECTHTHSNGRDDTAHSLFFFKYEIKTNGAKTLKLPDDEQLFILAATQAKSFPTLKCAHPLYDTVIPRDFDFHFENKKELLNYAFRKVLGLAWMIG